MSPRKLTIKQDVHRTVPSLYMESVEVNDITVTRTPTRIIESKKTLLSTWNGKTFDDVKNIATFKAYRKIHDKIGAYPDETLPAVENLYRREILQGRVPTINSVVDACNLVSVISQIPLGVFDNDQILGDITLRLAKKGDRFTPIGKTRPTDIPEGVPILEDQEKIISIPGVRDSNATKITKHTTNLLLFSWGSKDIPVDSVKTVLEEASTLIKHQK